MAIEKSLSAAQMGTLISKMGGRQGTGETALPVMPVKDSFLSKYRSFRSNAGVGRTPGAVQFGGDSGKIRELNKTIDQLNNQMSKANREKINLENLGKEYLKNVEEKKKILQNVIDQCKGSVEETRRRYARARELDATFRAHDLSYAESEGTLHGALLPLIHWAKSRGAPDEACEGQIRQCLLAACESGEDISCFDAWFEWADVERQKPTLQNEQSAKGWVQWLDPATSPPDQNEFFAAKKAVRDNLAAFDNMNQSKAASAAGRNEESTMRILALAQIRNCVEQLSRAETWLDANLAACEQSTTARCGKNAAALYIERQRQAIAELRMSIEAAHAETLLDVGRHEEKMAAIWREQKNTVESLRSALLHKQFVAEYKKNAEAAAAVHQELRKEAMESAEREKKLQAQLFDLQKIQKRIELEKVIRSNLSMPSATTKVEDISSHSRPAPTRPGPKASEEGMRFALNLLQHIRPALDGLRQDGSRMNWNAAVKPLLQTWPFWLEAQAVVNLTNPKTVDIVAKFETDMQERLASFGVRYQGYRERIVALNKKNPAAVDQQTDAFVAAEWESLQERLAHSLDGWLKRVNFERLNNHG